VKRPLPYVAALVSCLCLSASSHAADRNSFSFQDGDRIVLLGDDLIERNQKHGYLETLLTVLNPGKNLIVRNLGWSGDTVFGDARAGFGKRVDGFKQLKEHVLGLKPTVILVGYGMSESFDGKPGLASFEQGLNTLLDVLAETKAKVVLLAPIAHEDLGRPLPDPTVHNQKLGLYREAIARVADTRGYFYVDLASIGSGIDSTGGNGETKQAQTLTDDGIHLTEHGYWLADAKIASDLLENFGKPWVVRIKADGTAEAENVKVSQVQVSPQRTRFEALSTSLPFPARHAQAKEPDRVLEFEGLAPGRYTLKIDGQAVASGSADQWKQWELKKGPEFAQVETVRKIINEKNLLYFHRWRPQNETYLFGFRKHEQGNNARDIPLFDPLVEAKEQEVARLRVPVSHVYELIRESEVGR
jgi:lysophospholipase L1-like esterase